MSNAMKETVPAPASTFWYRGSLAAGWTIYIAGWVTWIVSLWLPASFLVQGATEPLPTIAFIVLDLIGCTGAALRFQFYWGLLALPYCLGLAAAIGCSLRPKSPRRLLQLRMTSLCGILAAPLGIVYLVGHQRNEFFLGFPFLGLGSTLICIGVWLIPPRRNVGKATGKVEEQRTSNDTNRGSLVGATVLAAGWVLWLFALFVPEYQPAGAPAASLRMFGILRTLFLTDCRSIFPFHFSAGLLWSSPYFFGLLAAIFWSAPTRVRAFPGFTVLLRIFSMGLLAPIIRTAVILTQPPSGIVFYGFFALSAASSLIFIGVWRIPPQKNREKSAGENGKQSKATQAAPIRIPARWRCRDETSGFRQQWYTGVATVARLGDILFRLDYLVCFTTSEGRLFFSWSIFVLALLSATGSRRGRISFGNANCRPQCSAG